MTNFDNIYTELLNTYEEDAANFKGYVTRNLLEKIFENSIDDDQNYKYILQSVLNFRDVVNHCFGASEEDMLRIIKAAQKHELAELYEVKTIEDLKNYRTRILTEFR